MTTDETATSWERIDRLAEAFFSAFCAGDAAVIERCLAPDFRAWHNHDGLFQTRAEHIDTLAWLKRSLADLRYEDVRRVAVPNGFLQEHVLRGTARGGDVALRACIVGQIDADGYQLIETREYLDSRQLAPLFPKG